MERKNNKSLTDRAKALRREMTAEERRLWYDFLRVYPARFQRQKVLGSYIADFYCASAKLVIEVDGSQHYEDAGMAYDARRTEYLNRYGIRVIRIPNGEIKRNFAGVCAYIEWVLKEDNRSV